MIAQNGVCQGGWLIDRSSYIEENSDRAGQELLRIARDVSKSQSAQHGDYSPRYFTRENFPLREIVKMKGAGWEMARLIIPGRASLKRLAISWPVMSC